MSRRTITRTLLAIASLLGAIPLMAQAAPTATAATAFPFGKYAIVALDSLDGPPPGMAVEFTPSALNVIRGGQVVETHGLSVTDGVLETFTLGDGCTDPGQYRWQVDGKWLTLILISDPCGNRSKGITSVRFEKL